ncbi:glycoside hydrolase family 2 protein [Macrococcus lamae]|uniref:Glycoside hydrolase family 2 n=2 Tax=Macrococcus TaxID=69965 RepID=A0A4R6BS84_9STAP|nr:sugar-binding domain-containing protein [Macrococcus lamae]TDM05249.1 glycoside hydrolase family 2 [Macrococcus lamae]
MTVLRQEYPRPQLKRNSWVNLNGEWDFSFDDKNVGQTEHWNENFPDSLKINVPFAFQTKLSGIHDTSFHDVVWYRRKVDIEVNESQKAILHFGAVDYHSHIYVNGQLVKEHIGGNSSFSVDITDYLSDDNEIVVRAFDPSVDQTIPRGKQYWCEESASIFYTRTSGIWQPVWIEVVNATYIKQVRWTPDIDAGHIRLELEPSQLVDSLKINVQIRFKDQLLVDDLLLLNDGYLDRSFNVRGHFVDRSNIHNDGWYWTPENPSLFDVTLKLVQDDTTLDTVESYFGMRKVGTNNGRFQLNNKDYYQKLVLDQGYFPDGLLTAPSGEDLKKDIELAKALGFNGARKHQKVEDPLFLYWADTLGFLVWGEMAAASEYSEKYVERMTNEWIEVVNRDYNHPSIVAWMPLNESWGISRVNHEKRQQAHSMSMYYLTKSLDETRVVFSNDGWEHTKSDICGIHNYSNAEQVKANYETLEKTLSIKPANREIYCEGFSYDGEPIMITEYGGIAYTVEDKGWGYSSVKSSEELIEGYQAVTSAIGSSELIHGFCYTQLTDVEQEINGLLTYDRQPKCDIEQIKAVNDTINNHI